MLGYKEIEELLSEKETINKKISLARKTVLDEIATLFDYMKKLTPDTEITFADVEWDLYPFIDTIIKEIKKWEKL